MGAIQAAGQPADVGPSLDSGPEEVKVAARPLPFTLARPQSQALVTPWGLRPP